VRTGRALLAGALAATLAVTGCSAATPPPAPKPAATTVPTSPAPDPTAFPAALAGQDIERLPTKEKVVALTFDAGANADAVPSILATLAREHIAATFFLTGDFVTKYPGPSKQIAAAGHRIGNHSATHPAFDGLALALVRHEVLDGGQSIRAVTGADPRPLFRFPFGSKDGRAMTEVNALGYIAVRWTVDSLGWQGTMNGTRGPDFTAARVLSAATPGGIVLMHVGSHPTDHSMLDAEALPAVIAGLRQKSYGFTTLRTLLG
jgi:peptidoglycan/xylan/chitin deacetylase (PgdA/CDA1 family)